MLTRAIPLLTATALTLMPLLAHAAPDRDERAWLAIRVETTKGVDRADAERAAQNLAKAIEVRTQRKAVVAGAPTKECHRPDICAFEMIEQARSQELLVASLSADAEGLRVASERFVSYEWRAHTAESRLAADRAAWGTDFEKLAALLVPEGRDITPPIPQRSFESLAQTERKLQDRAARCAASPSPRMCKTLSAAKTDEASVIARQ